jgi:hypothetical protein
MIAINTGGGFIFIAVSLTVRVNDNQFTQFWIFIIGDTAMLVNKPTTN